jgi:hypothetical protein
MQRTDRACDEAATWSDRIRTKGQASPDDIRSFVTACYEAACRTGGRVTGAREPGVTPTFHTVVISYEDVHIAVLRHDWLGVIPELAHDHGLSVAASL